MQFLSSYWWLLFVFGGSIAGGGRAIMAANDRREERRLERYRIKHAAKAAVLEAGARESMDREVQLRTANRVLAEHDAVDERWFGYETDVVTMLEYPMMTDMRESLTVAFHRAKREADAIRPDTAEELVGREGALTAYRSAVHDYAIAFDAAESEARRRKRGDFSETERDRLVRAQSLLRVALDSAGTPAERQTAYRKARAELDGLVSLPAASYADVERKVAGELEA
ncbi:hypothetical protein KIK15_01555 [Williamsia sp. CHRR-6]|nr:hypothetical protein [Williamsia sp. CHRR-6]